MNNYKLQQYFLDLIKSFALSNPNKEINKNFVYSILTEFNTRIDQGPRMDISYNFEYWINRYKNTSNMEIFKVKDRPFLWFQNGQINGNEIKIYIPLDYIHIREGANQIFDYLASNNIVHQSKIAKIIRTDNIVIRVTTLEDADKILKYVTKNPYLMQGLMKVNPFLVNYQGIGVTMDNFTSYNSNVAQAVSNFLNELRMKNRLDLFTVDEFNKYIKTVIPYINDPDIKDIYILLSKVTTKNFEFKEFAEFAQNKIPDKYDENEKRITNPEFYFEQAVKATEQIYPGNAKEAILNYLKGNPNFFTRKDQSRFGLIKYVQPKDVKSIMQRKLKERNVQEPLNINDLIDEYLNILLYSKVNSIEFDILVNAYRNTLNKYGKKHAFVALKQLLMSGEVTYFTNDFKSRDKLKRILHFDIKKIIISNIDINNLDINDINEIIYRFEEILKVNQINNQKV